MTRTLPKADYEYARRHLWSLAARGVDADTICTDMRQLGWPPNAVLNAVHDLLRGTLAEHGLTPSERALFILMGQAKEDPSTPGGYRLRGKAVRLSDVINAANVVLANFGFEAIKHPGISEGAV